MNLIAKVSVMNHSSIRIILLSFILVLTGCNNQTQKGVEAPQTETHNNMNQDDLQKVLEKI